MQVERKIHGAGAAYVTPVDERGGHSVAETLVRCLGFESRHVAQRMGIELVPLQVRSPKEVPQRLTEMHKRKVDALWLLPDSTAVTPETVDAYFTFAQRSNLPIIGYSAAYLAKGALAAVELIRHDIGRQLCDKVRTSKSGVTSGTSDASTGRVFFNDAVAEKLALFVNASTIITACDHP